MCNCEEDNAMRPIPVAPFKCVVHRAMLVALATVAVIATGCTTVPTKEFQSYKDAFKEARTAGEQVLLDYGAAAALQKESEGKRAAAAPQRRIRATAFDASLKSDKASVDHVAVRMKAWDVVSRYDD